MALSSSVLPRVKHHLRASEQRDGFPRLAMGHGCVSHLRRLAQVCGLGDTFDRAIGRGTEVV